MDKQSIINLTKDIYRLTLLFPKKEPLRYKMREAADDILADFTNDFTNVTRKDLVTRLEVIEGFFEVAKAQNWVKTGQLLEVQGKYDILKREIETRTAESAFVNKDPSAIESHSEVRPIQNTGFLPERQVKILAFLREQGRAQVWQLKEILPEVTKRTLRRDFDALLRQGLVERIGERNNTFYQIKPGSRNLTSV